MSGLATLLHAELKARGWSLRDLASAAGVTASALSALMNNPERVPDLRTLAALSVALNLPLRQLIESCGFPLDAPHAEDDQAQRAQAVLAAVPELQQFVDDIAALDAGDRESVMVYIETLLRRKRKKA